MTSQKRYEHRYEMVKFAMKYGKKPAAREFNTTVKTVRLWVKRYEREQLSGLKDKTRRPKSSPNKCDPEFEKEVITLRKKTKNRFGAVRLIERFDLKYGKACVQRIINEHGLKRARKTVKQKRNELWSVKKLMKAFEKIQIDVKELTDIPVYFSSYCKNKLPKYELTARCVKTGASFVCYAKRNTAANAASFAGYLIEHLKSHNFDVTTIEFQTDNGSEFNACGKRKEGHTPFEYIIKEVYTAKLGFIPPASPTFNSDVETFHRLVEDEFYAIEPIHSFEDLQQKMYTYLIDFNFLRKNSYKDKKTPFELARQDFPNFNKQLFNLAPILMDDNQHFYLDHCKPPEAIVTQKSDKLDPFEDPNFLRYCDMWGISTTFQEKHPQGGYNVSGLHNLDRI